MCGIAGHLHWGKPDTISSITAMVEKLHHRGPDGSGITALNQITLGHTRLAVIDTRNLAKQPMVDSSQRYWITFNGEIYNHKNLRQQLEAKGEVFRSHSDTEVLLTAWKCWGTACLDKLVGMFAFAIWDNHTQALFLVRDRMGEKPLYYMQIDTAEQPQIIFASELSALLAHPMTATQINPEAINLYLDLNYIPNDLCIIRGVKKLPPAHYLCINASGSRQQEYWQLNEFFKQPKSTLSIEDASEQLGCLLQNSLTLQKVSDVPLGAFLSGGLDSSTIVSELCKQNHTHQTETFSIGFNQKTFSELTKSKQVAKHLHVNHHTEIVDTSASQLLQRVMKFTDEPFADTSIIPTFALAEFTRQHVTVALSGDGADELFAGYETYTAGKLYQLLRYLPLPCLNMIRNTLNFLPTSFNKVSLDFKLKQFFSGLAGDFCHAHSQWRRIFHQHEKSQLFYGELSSGSLNLDNYFRQHIQRVHDCHYLQQASYVDLKTWLPDNILVKVDRASMAHSLECRTPFLDHRLVEFAAQLPIQLKMPNFKKKFILKYSQEHNLPKKIIHQKKAGFNSPVSHWLKGEMGRIGKDLTMSSHMSQWFNRDAIEKLWQQHQSMQYDNGLKLFGLVCFAHWHVNFISRCQENKTTFKEDTPDVIRRNTCLQ